MNGLAIVIGILGVWRVTHLLHAEDGPGGVITKLRRRVGDGVLGAAMDCFDCLSVWVAAPFALMIGESWLDRLLVWPALSAGAMMANRVLSRVVQPAAASYLEDPVDEHGPEEQRPDEHPAVEVSDVQLRQRPDESRDVEP
jgi:hypothetical protein